MPVLKDLRKEIELKLPTTGGKVWIYDYLIAKDSIEIDQIFLKETNIDVKAVNTNQTLSIRASKYYEAQDKTLIAMVSRWDFVDEEGKKLEMTLENLGKLPKQDYEFIVKEVEERVNQKIIEDSQKKN